MPTRINHLAYAQPRASLTNTRVSLEYFKKGVVQRLSRRSCRRAASSRGSKMSLEKQLQRELDTARPAATQNRVAQAHVGSCCERVKVGAGAIRIESVRRSVGKEGRQQRTGKSGMIEGVVEIRSELHLQALVDISCFADGKVKIPVIGSWQRIAALISRSGASLGRNSCRQCPRHPECMVLRTKTDPEIALDFRSYSEWEPLHQAGQSLLRYHRSRLRNCSSARTDARSRGSALRSAPTQIQIFQVICHAGTS